MKKWNDNNPAEVGQRYSYNGSVDSELSKNSGGVLNMSYKVAICDDEICTCKNLEEMLRKAFMSVGVSANIDVFYSGEKIVQYLKYGNTYDFIFLDIELYELNGVDVGKYIRNGQNNIETQIVFISSKTSYAMELFAVQPLDFIVKPISEKSVLNAINKGMRYLGNSDQFFSYQFQKETKRINCSDIIYFKSELRTVVIVTTSGEEVFYSRIATLKDELPDYFVQIHQSYIINLYKVKSFKINEIIMINNEHVPVSRKYKSLLRTKTLSKMIQENEP